MITRVQLRNWKSHQETEIHLGDGTNVLVGMMGAGKSAVLDAITYALFGTLPAVKSRRIKLEDLIFNRPKPAERAEVEVAFKTLDGEEFVVKRGIQRGKGTTIVELRKGSGELIESGSSDRVTENIQGLLSVDYDLYERAIYAEQNRLDYFLTIPKGKRMDNMDELLGINKLENVRKRMGALANRILARAEDLKNRAEQLKQDESLAKLPELEREIQELEGRISKNRQKLDELKKELDFVNGQYEELRELERNISTMKAQYMQLSATASSIDEQIKGCIQGLGTQADFSLDELQRTTKLMEDAWREKNSAMEKTNSEWITAKMQLQSLEESNERIAREIIRLEQELERERKIKEELDRVKLEDLEAEILRVEGEYRRLLNEQAITNARIKELKRSEEELLNAEASCPVCESPLDDAKKSELIDKRRGEIGVLENNSRQMEKWVARVKKEWDEKREGLQKILLLKKEVEGLSLKEEEYSKRREELQEIGQRIPVLQATTLELESKVARAKSETEKMHLEYMEMKRKLELKKTFDELESRLQATEMQRLEVKRKLDELQIRYDETKFKELERRKSELSTDYGRLEEQIRGDGALSDAKRRTVEEIKGKLNTIKQFEVEAKHLQGASHALGTIQTAIAKTQTTLRQQFLDSVNMIMGDIWESIYPYRDFVGIRLTVESKGGDYALQLRDRAGNWVPVEGIASGGERTDAVLALRIAFAMVLAPNLKWMVFDEPTHNLDMQGIDELAKIMRERLPEVVRQILLITHEERLEGAVSGYLYRFYRNKATDEPTRIEQVMIPEFYD
jgi:exonuclease SbcC